MNLKQTIPSDVAIFSLKIQHLRKHHQKKTQSGDWGHVFLVIIIIIILKEPQPI